jgi:hypothetical protein
MKVTIETAKNGYLIICDDEVYVANNLSTYTYQQDTVIEILKTIFEQKVAKDE